MISLLSYHELRLGDRLTHEDARGTTYVVVEVADVAGRHGHDMVYVAATTRDPSGYRDQRELPPIPSHLRGWSRVPWHRVVKLERTEGIAVSEEVAASIGVEVGSAKGPVELATDEVIRTRAAYRVEVAKLKPLRDAHEMQVNVCRGLKLAAEGAVKALDKALGDVPNLICTRDHILSNEEFPDRLPFDGLG